MKKVFIYVLMVIMVLSLVACSQPVSGDVLQSDKQRVTPELNKDELAILVAGNSAFAFDLYRALKGTQGNLFYSPYSISAALAMTYAGARGETEKEMGGALHFTLPQNQLHPAFNSLEIELARRGEAAKGKDGEGFRLNVVNAIWGQKDFKFLPDFLDTLAENYGAGLRVLDFRGTPEDSRATINKWVSDQTESRIKDLIPQGVIDSLTRLVLTNAIYFNAAWQYPLKQGTDDGQFHLLDGNEVTVPFMKQTEQFGYATGDGYQAVELPYDGGELSMVILLPEPGQLESFEASLNAAQVDGIIQKIGHNRQVVLSLPKFEFESSFSLKEALSAMGMPAAFSADADFSGMTGDRDLFIGEVLHKSFISVDENGTEAAAASAVIMKVTAMPTDSVEVTVDRPFIFLIRDIETGAILFIGRMISPAL